MRSVAVRTTVAEYDLINAQAPATKIESFFQKPLAAWDQSALDLGETEAIQRVSVAGAATQTIDIIREDRAVWVTYSVTLEFDYSPNAINYFGVSLQDIAQRGCRVEFTVDGSIAELVEEKTETRVMA